MARTVRSTSSNGIGASSPARNRAYEVAPVAGDPGTMGTVHVTLNLGQGEVCFQVEVEGYHAPIVAAHIHAGDAATNGRWWTFDRPRPAGMVAARRVPS